MKRFWSITLVLGAFAATSDAGEGGKDKEKKEKKEGAAPAAIQVRCPPFAEQVFDGQPTRQRGSVRFFTTPPLEPGYKYSYELTARWMGPDGKEMKDSRQVNVSAGKTTTVDLIPKQKEKEKDKEKPKDKEK